MTRMGQRHQHQEPCGCGHYDGPRIGGVQTLSSKRDALARIASIPIRSYSGAPIVLVTAALSLVGLGADNSEGVQTLSVTLYVIGGALVAILSIGKLLLYFLSPVLFAP
ncbi:MAG: hypothetical protein ACSHXB_10775 [Sulfitobacter sp.]